MAKQLIICVKHLCEKVKNCGSAALEGHGEELVMTSSQPVAGHSPTLQYVAKQVLAALL